MLTEKKIKILFLIPDLGGGGAEKVLVNLANNLDKNIYDPTIQTISDKGVNREFLNKDVHYKYCLSKIPRGWSHFFKLFSPFFLHRIFIKEDYDIEVAFLEGPSARIIAGSDNPNVKRIAWIHCTMAGEADAKKAFRSLKEAKELYSRFDKIICVSEGVKEHFDKIFNINKTEVIYNLNDSEKVREISKSDVDISYNKDEFNIISVGSMNPRRAYIRLAGVQKRLIETGYKTHIYVLGEGPEKTKIQKYIKENNLERVWTLLGYKKNPYAYVAKADLYVCPSFSEGLSTAVTEALFVGCPTLSTRVSGTKELLGERGEYGLVVDNNEQAIYEGITKLIDNKELLNHYKEMAKVRGYFFGKERILNMYNRFFREMI